MSGKSIANPWSVLDQVDEWVRRGFGTTKLEAIDNSSPSSLGGSIRRGVHAELLTALLENHALLANENAERQS
jgi:hypothetical protein